MKQLTLVVLKNEQTAALEALQDLGVMHLATAPPPDEEAITTIRARLEGIRRAAEVLAKLAPTEVKPVRRSPQEVVAEVQRLTERLSGLNDTRLELLLEQERLASFGSFEPEAIHRLEAQGIGIRLFRLPVRQAFESPEGTAVVELSRDRRQRCLALVGPLAAVAQADILEEVPIPDASPATLARKLLEVEQMIARTREELAALAGHLEAVKLLADRTEDRLHFEEARATMTVIGALAYVCGFCPEREVPQVQALAEVRGWGLLVEEVSNPNEVPTKIENPRWVKPIQPIMSFLGVIPGYDQVDISTPFLIFFGLFFAMIVGDAGYGLLFLLLTLWGQRRYPQAPKNLFSLLKLLSVATIVWGVLTGSYFGLAAPALLELLKVTWLLEQDNIILLSFIIGAVHLTLAHGWNVVRFFPSSRALAQVGWIITTWSMFFLARTLVLGMPFPAVMLPLMAVGVVLIVVFMTPWQQLKHEWFNHAMLPLTLVSNFVDVISYVRLFAVGAATFAVASAFNEMALAIGAGGLLASILAALILFFGHTLNILLAAMGVLVHGVRLNTLEFAGHLGMSWSGRPYRPFARKARREAA
jgi:V/A-type H+-transporting ATPase subunit I